MADDLRTMLPRGQWDRVLEKALAHPKFADDGPLVEHVVANKEQMRVAFERAINQELAGGDMADLSEAEIVALFERVAELAGRR
jgi:hypothetical protein